MRIVKIGIPGVGSSVSTFGSKIGITSDDDLSIVTTDIERIRITSRRNVGIGNFIPSSSLFSKFQVGANLSRVFKPYILKFLCIILAAVFFIRAFLMFFTVFL